MTTARPSFINQDLDATNWEALEPLYRRLLEREADDLERLLLDRSELDSAAREAYTNLYIQMTCHTDDEQAKADYLSFVEDVQPKLKQVGFELDRKIVGAAAARRLDAHRYEVLLRDLGVDVAIFREQNIPLQTEDTTLDQQYDETCGAMTIEFRGAERTIPQMGRFLEEPDRPTRQEAWCATTQRRFQDRERLHEIFERMLQLRGTIATNAGFANYRDYAFKRKHRFDYTPADCETFHQGVEQVCVVLLRQLNARRAEALRVDPLRPWDLGVDVLGRPPLRPFEDADELVNKTSRAFHEMDPQLGAMFDSLRNGDCLDLASRKAKAPGGYQAYRDRSRKPFIFMNAAGLHRDLDTMVHEAGHAFHSILCQDEPLIHYRHAPIEFAEVASMTMELFSFPHLDAFYDDADAARATRKHLENILTLLPWIATIDAFQHWLYTHTDHGRDERTEQWLELDDRFGPAVSWEGFEPHRQIAWQRQGHLFGAPFYYIEYGIAQLGALQLWLQFRNDGTLAIENYKRALALGGSRPLPELFTAAGIEFAFGPDTMGRLMEEVQRVLEGLPD